MPERVAIIGAVAAPVGRYARPRPGGPPIPEQRLLTDVAARALRETGVRAAEVGSAVFTMATPDTRQLGFATHVAARLGLSCTAGLAEVMEMGITGGLAFDQACADILLGRTEVALALGAAYTSGGDPVRGMLQGVRVVGDVEFQAPFGATPIAWYAMDALRYVHETGATREEIAAVAVKSRAAARRNALAQFRDPLSLAQVLAARMIVEPLGLYEVPSTADGAVCVVLASEAFARRSARPYVVLRGRGFCHDGYHPIDSRPHDITAFPALRAAARDALAEAAVELDDIDVAELYAPCTISEVLATEALGLFERGAGARAAAAGVTAVGGARPVNTSGGCLSRGHPPALTALYGLVELREQLLGLSGPRQVDGARLGLASCEAGNYNAAIVHVLEAAR